MGILVRDNDDRVMVMTLEVKRIMQNICEYIFEEIHVYNVLSIYL